MAEFRSFAPADLAAIDLQRGQSYMDAVPEWREAGATYAAGPSWTAEHDGRVIGCAGFLRPWQGRACCWALLSCNLPTASFLRVDRFVRARMNDLAADGVWRFEAECARGFAPAERWLMALGFKIEAVARGFSPDRRDFLRWSKVLPA